ncbi:GTPase [Stratiformator vulcanicus]|uniref:GTPase Era n=1 Tax=Stratiformator vulcanicus TaxID=2527980 RepID=A0A517R6A7_9PLAN|nr:GTPase [Stratiformator vulcanicus]QDT39375.1 GTPase Era [Stratiformator vulcanicus]
MTSLLQEYAGTLERLERELHQLEQNCGLLQLDPIVGRPWHELLVEKLIPQTGRGAYLVVGIVGGTNIGKSVIFNHLAGERVSATTPLASGTRHPVCLVPQGFGESRELAEVFPKFDLKPWVEADAALQEDDRDLLFWRESGAIPSNLVLLDTPDVDSDARVNWDRAAKVRSAADVLLVVLTQQKYNDAAIREFFARAAREEKAIVLVFNQLHLPEDADYWTTWTKTFCESTGVSPEYVYLAPHDRAAAEQGELSFVEHSWPPEAEDGKQIAEGRACDLAESLSRLHFDEVRLRTLKGAIRQLADRRAGIPGYLAEIQERSGRLAAVEERLRSESVVRISDWPTIPANTLVSEIRRWWKEHQTGWVRGVSSFYDVVGTGVMWPVKQLRGERKGRTAIDSYREAEWSAVVRGVTEIVDRLTWMADTGGDLVGEPIRDLLARVDRGELLERLREGHLGCDLQADLQLLVEVEMQKFEKEAPITFAVIQKLHVAGAGLRPVMSVGLFLGFGGADIAAQALTSAVAQSTLHVMADLAGGTAASVAGEQVVAKGAGYGVGQLQAMMQRLQDRFAERRLAWFAELLRREFLGELADELASAATLAESKEFQNVSELTERLPKQFEEAIEAMTASDNVHGQ